MVCPTRCNRLAEVSSIARIMVTLTLIPPSRVLILRWKLSKGDLSKSSLISCFTDFQKDLRNFYTSGFYIILKVGQYAIA